MRWSLIETLASILFIGAVTAGLFGLLFQNLEPLSSSAAAVKSTLWLWSALGAVVALILAVVGGLWRRSWWVLVIWPLVCVGLGWLAYAGLVFAYQDALLFSPRPANMQRVEELRQRDDVEELFLPMSDGTILQGWLVKRGSVEPGPLMILFYGQAGEASRYVDMSENLRRWSTAIVNYRGYGLSEGRPNAQLLLDDALTIFDLLAEREDVDEQRIVTMGGSLGSGVALYTAAKRPASGVVVFSPYDTIVGGVTKDLIPLLPVEYIFRQDFDITEQAETVQVPVWAVIGMQDTVIYPARSEAILERIPSTVYMQRIEDGDHYSIYEDDNVWANLNAFLRVF